MLDPKKFYLLLMTDVSIFQSAVKEGVNMDHFLSGVFQRHTKVKEQERRHSLDSFFIFFPASTGKWLQKAQISGMLPEQDCAVILAVKVEEKGQNCLFPNQTNSSWFLKQDICHKFLAVLTVIDNSHMGTRFSADQRSN